MTINADKARLFDEEWVEWGELYLKPIKSEERRRSLLDGDPSAHEGHYTEFLYVVNEIKMDFDKLSLNEVPVNSI